MTRRTILSALLTTVLTAAPFAALAQTADDLKNDDRDRVVSEVQRELRHD